MSAFTRLTVIGSVRRAELAVPRDEPLGALIPQLIDLLTEPTGTVATPLALVTADGEQVDLDRSVQQQELPDGAALRLVRIDIAPPPPVVIDVTDALADALDARGDRWSDRARRGLGAVLAGTAMAVAAAPLAQLPERGLVVAGALIVLLLAAGISFGLLGRGRVAVMFAAAAAGATVPLAATSALQSSAGHVSSLLSPLSTALCAGGVVLLLGVGVALRDRGALAGGAIAVILGGIQIGLPLLGMPLQQMAAITGVLAALLIGLVPWAALSISGLTGLDDRAAEEGGITRVTADAAVDDAYRALNWSAVATAASLAISGAMLVAAGGVWSYCLAASLALVALLRTRAFPLRVPVLLLWAAALLIALTALPALNAALGAQLLAMIAVLVAIIAAAASLAQPRAHQRARLRALGNTVEMIAVTALIPLAVGVFGVYGDLLALFGGGA